MIDTSLAWLLDEPLNAEERSWDHAMDISASVHHRMAELGMNGKELAVRLGVTPGRVSQILKGDENLTLKTLARLEEAQGFDLSWGFTYFLRDSGVTSRQRTSYTLSGVKRWGEASNPPYGARTSFDPDGVNLRPARKLELVA